ncbi:sortase-dependent protein [Streptomyces sp. NPDC001698]|uniref:sortase-dependent protein n=1 Tax=unclassified Streptomyces TaxID=2593676 RepID=UPI0036A994B3
MRRTILTAAAVACTAVLAGTAPAFADGAAPSPVPTRAATPAEADSATPAPVAEPTRAPARSQVRAVPAGAPDTGVTTPAQESGSRDGLIGGVGVALVMAGGAVLVVRRRRATGA